MFSFDADTIKLKFDDFISSLRISPEYRRNVLVIMASAATIIVSACAIGKSVGSHSRISHLEEQAASYKEGQIQIDDVLGGKETIQLSKESKDILGETGLMLQYKDLSALPEQNSFSDMENALDIEADVDNENKTYAESVSESIPDFAGNYGGLEIDVGAVSGNNIRLAAYTDRSEMTAHDDSTVQNVLYQKIDRTIKAEKYGESDKKNTLIILSGTDIRGFSRISSNAEMYTMFGESTGTKSIQKYVCTGVERGTISETADSDVNYMNPNEDAATGNGEDSYESSSSAVSNADSRASESYTQQSDKSSASPSDSSSDSTVQTDESSDSSSYDDEAEIIIDNEAKADIIKTSVPMPAALPITMLAVGNDNLIFEDTEASYVDSNETYADENAENTESDASSDPVSARNIINAENVLGSDEWPITKNQKADLILYQYDTASKSVTITYWNIASNAD